MSRDDAQMGGFPLPADVPLDVTDTLAVARYGSELLQAIEHAAVGTFDREGAAALVTELGDIHQALLAMEPAVLRRQAGLLGRLLGRDVEAQARAEALLQRLDTGLLRADAAAARLQHEVAQRGTAATQLRQAALAIQQWAQAGEPLWQQLSADAGSPQTAVMALRRRLDHLHRLAALRTMEAGQLQLLQAQAIELLEHYQRVREVLIPTWQQQLRVSPSTAAAMQLRQLGDSQARILAELEAMQARLR